MNETVTSLTVALPGVDLVEPKVLDVGSDFGLGPNSWVADHALKGVGSMRVGTEQLLVPMASHWLQAALELVLGLTGSKVAEFELGMEAMC